MRSCSDEKSVGGCWPADATLARCRTSAVFRFNCISDAAAAGFVTVRNDSSPSPTKRGAALLVVDDFRRDDSDDDEPCMAVRLALVSARRSIAGTRSSCFRTVVVSEFMGACVSIEVTATRTGCDSGASVWDSI